jgi:hypothetical protein
VQGGIFYWSSTSVSGLPTLYAWGLDMINGVTYGFVKDDRFDPDSPHLFVWPVRGPK